MTEPQKLTDAYVARLAVPGDYYDSELRSFFVRVTEKGTKTYYVKNRVVGSDRPSDACVYVKIDRAERISAKDARGNANDRLTEMRHGINPNDDRKRQRELRQQQEAQKLEAAEQLVIQERAQGVTFAEVLAHYIKVRSLTGKRPLKASTAADYEKLSRLYLSDWFDLPIASIDSSMVTTRFMEISLRSKAQADKVFRVARALFNHSDIEELTSLSQNPCKTLQKKWHQLGPRQRIIKDSQLKKWYQAVLLLDNTHARDYLRITLFLGLRRNEAASLEWQYVDFDENTITIINTKNQRTHVAPMTRIVRQILLERREFLKATGEYGEYVFPGKSGHLKDPRKAICRVTKDCKIEFNSHDLRRTMATIADGLGIDYFTIGRMLNHKSAGGKAVTKDYIVSTAKALREPLERVNGYICEQIGIEKSA